MTAQSLPFHNINCLPFRAVLAALGLLETLVAGVLTPTALAHGDHGPRDATPALGLADTRSLPATTETLKTRLDRRDARGGGFHTVSLAPLANARLEQPDQWRDRVWKHHMSQLPRGEQSFAGIPFYVVPPSENKGLAAVTLAGGRYKEGPSGGGAIAIGRKAGAIYVLHTASYQNLNLGRVMAQYKVIYSDGTCWDIPVRNKLEAADFFDDENLTEDCVIGWSAKHPMFPYTYGVYVARFVNPHPDKEIASFELKPSGGSAVVATLGLTLGESAPGLIPLPGKKLFQRPTTAQGPIGRLALTIKAEGVPTAARVVVEGSDGKAYQPLDGLNYAMLGRGKPFFYAKDQVALDVPAGCVKISVAKGFEYKPVELTVNVPTSETLRQTVDLERWIDMPELGWYSGEMHIHPFDQEPEDTAVSLLAEDLHIGNLLIWANGFGFRWESDQFFRGKAEAWPDATHAAYYNEEFRNNTYGHLCLIDLRSLVYPMGTGSEYNSEDYPANAAIMDRTHDQKAFVSVAHMSIPPVNYAVPWEVSVDVALGKADSVDLDLRSFDRGKDRSLELWYRLLNCGHKIPGTCGTDSFMNQTLTNNPLGNIRAYAYLGRRFSYASWVAAARAGRSFVTEGPALFLSVNGKRPGEEIRLKKGSNKLAIEATASSLYALKQIEVVVNGDVVASVTAQAGAREIVLNKSVEINGADSAWIAARVAGESSGFFLRNELLAHTNPVYCVGKSPLRSADDARFFMSEIDGLLDWVEHKGIFQDPAHRAEVRDLFLKARALYEKQATGKE